MQPRPTDTNQVSKAVQKHNPRKQLDLDESSSSALHGALVKATDEFQAIKNVMVSNNIIIRQSTVTIQFNPFSAWMTWGKPAELLFFKTGYKEHDELSVHDPQHCPSPALLS
ncbi:hypothetical protein EMCRGX_G021058 [Ephydatia muelleri]